MSGAGAAGRVGLAFVPVALAALALSSSAAAAPPYADAVLLVSGFDTATPFTTPDPLCNGKEGEAWNPPTGVAATLKAAGRSVFTAPVRQGGTKGLAPCNPDGPAPPQSSYIDSNGELDSNGAALASLIGFLRDRYGIQRLQLVGHSDGGLWSRSAIDQDAAYAGVSVLSLTTLGTPHTGSFVADLAVEVEGGRCSFENSVLEGICVVFQGAVEAIVDDIGQTATEELTNDFLGTWNPRQAIGSCPVTGIAGTFVHLPLVPFTYYNPDDGLVGEASALARSAYDIGLHEIPAPPIPNFRVGGTYPVVHGSSIGALSKQTLLNTQAISDKVAETVASTPASGPLCNAAAAAVAHASAAPPRSRDRAAPLRLPLTRLVLPSRQGRLPAPNREDAVLTRRGVRVGCGARRTVPLTPLLGDRHLHVAHLRGCRQVLRIRKDGNAHRGALLIRRHAKGGAFLALRGDRVRLRVRGMRTRSVRAFVERRGKWKRLKLDRKGRGPLPRKATRAAIRLIVEPRSAGRPWTATAVLRH